MIDHVVGDFHKVSGHLFLDGLVRVDLVEGSEYGTEPMVAHLRSDLPLKMALSQSGMASFVRVSLRTSENLKQKEEKPSFGGREIFGIKFSQRGILGDLPVEIAGQQSDLIFADQFINRLK